MTLFQNKITLAEWKTHWIWDPKIASLNLSAADIFFLRVGFRFLFTMYVFENVCSFVFSFFILTFEQCLKLWQKRNFNAKQNSLRWNAENKILIKERFSKFNCYISEKNAQDQLFLYTDDNIAIFGNCIYMQVFYISHFLEFQNLHTEH